MHEETDPSVVQAQHMHHSAHLRSHFIDQFGKNESQREQQIKDSLLSDINVRGLHDLLFSECAIIYIWVTALHLWSGEPTIGWL